MGRILMTNDAHVSKAIRTRSLQVYHVFVFAHELGLVRYAPPLASVTVT